MVVLFYVNSVSCYISLLFCVVLGIACAGFVVWILAMALFGVDWLVVL